ncbi:hypothetical protein [Bradyrhizobium sp. LMTR 3]|uniref:hypothetical protein n=1 Tax=Bradyrhizobium sp. LMTR 3 TaxID=189873 RepID=UPI00114757EB|nr:hypothetical protein [Bradyrhizobium sp. LMTR 3]
MARHSITCRAASEEHHTGILAVLEEAAPEIPVDLNSADKQEIIKAIIFQCCGSGNSLVAVDAKGAVVGFVLAKPGFHEFQCYFNAIHRCEQGVA